MGGLYSPNNEGCFGRHAEGENSRLGAGTKTEEVAVGRTRSTQERYALVLSNVILGADFSWIASSWTACGAMGG